MLVIDKYYLYTLDEINSEPNKDIREIILKKRNDELREMGSNYFERSIIKKYSYMSLEEISNVLELKLMEATSNHLFPDQLVICYPLIREVRASKQYTCDISGSIIKKDSIYINYKMFMDNLSLGCSFVLDKPIISELAYRDFYPRSISELDLLDCKLRNPFDYSDGYNYYDISKRIGEGINLRRL